MKAITLWQPWASAMAEGLKRNETRGRAIRYRGDLAICSAKRAPEGFLGMPEFEMPLGVVFLVADRARLPLICVSELEYSFGNYQPGRFAWRTKNLRKLNAPVPVIGRQGLFNLPEVVAAKVRAQL